MCLLKAEEHEQILERKPSEPTKDMSPTQIPDTFLESVVTLFNVNEPFPDLELAWLTKLKDKHNEGQLNKKPKVVDCLQGVSRITELPDSIGKHSSLVILDLKECHNLEMLPEEITKLKELRYLDLSDCYLLARLPKGQGVLSELIVLKGFIISNPSRKNSGTLNDLKGLEKLRKLTINASSEEFPTLEDLLALQQLGKKSLRKLTIAWGAEPNKAEPKTEDSKNGNADKQAPKCLNFLSSPRASKPSETEIESSTLMRLPEQLGKLDLQCFPKSTAKWLTPESLPDLEELYIRGGKLATLEKSEWSKVKTLRLKYLRELKMTWIELQKYFPKLEYLEKVKCPGITLCPCDQHGVWMKTI
ncbi:disease resistance RPP13-like protein 4 [Quercus robur]|uniref:disease resistance RPP13-like protein 4 n=1 Tax=Quercus robur TaxID=38942 RepID=UPI00216212EA|nr:disease resistance RPP13-like protein 4 [Quercus robur]